MTGDFRKFVYRAFWDVPRCILIDFDGVTLYLRSDFDEALDDYAPQYDVFLMPPGFQPGADWTHAEASAIRKLGTLAVSEVEFDATKREALNIEAFRRFGSSLT
jgi:hypothetical protein